MLKWEDGFRALCGVTGKNEEKRTGALDNESTGRQRGAALGGPRSRIKSVPEAGAARGGPPRRS